MGGRVVLERNGGAMDCLFIFKDLSRNCAVGEGGKVKSHPSTRVVLERCLRVFSWARIVAQRSAAIHSRRCGQSASAY
jgi:hypothetical protein